MLIGFDISQTGAGKAGCGYYADALIRALVGIDDTNHYALYPSFGDFYFDARMPLTSPVHGRHVDYGPRHLTRENARAFWTGSGVEEALGHPDIVHANNFWCPPRLGSGRLIYTLYDLGFLVDPRWTTEANRIGCFDGVFRAAGNADWIVAISRASRDHYLACFPNFDPEHIRVIYPCSRFSDPTRAGKAPAALRGVEPGRFWLSVGTIEPRKNQRRLAEAYAAYLARGGAPMPLVFAGGSGWLMENFRQHLVDLGIDGAVIMTGYVSDDELIWLYRNCFANLYASLFEGFGLPVLEGMQFGAPTFASNASSLPEVTADAAIALDPNETTAWTDAMLRLATDPASRRRLSEASLARAGAFDWRASAGSLLDLYREAHASPPRRLPEAARD